MVDTGTNTGKAAFGAALAAVVIGVCVLAGWLFELEFLKRIVPGLVAMNPATAVAFILAGASLALFLQSPHGRDQKSRALILMARLCALVVTLIGLAKLVGILFGWDLGVDRWLFASKLPDGLRFPNRIAPNTALNFLLLGSALLFVDVKNRSVRFCVEFSVVVVGFGSLLAVLAYAYDIQSFYGLGAFIPMALHTAITFSVLMVAFLLSHTDSGLLAVFAGDSAGGTMARRLLPAAVLVPAVLGWLTRQGEEAGIYHAAFGEAVFAVGNILVFTFLVCWSAKGLFSADLGRKKAEEALRLLNSAVLQSKEAILITDAELDLPGPKIIFVNPAFTQMTGYTAEEAIGKTPRILQGPRTDKTVLSRLRQNLERGEAFEGETINYRKDGKEFNLEWQIAPIRNASGKIAHFVAIQRDITERQRAAEELRESERRFSDMLRNLELVSMMLDRDARITYCNDYLLRLTGWKREEVIGRNWFELFLPPELVDELEGVHSALLADQSVAWHYENQIVTRSGARRVIRWNNSVLRSASGDVIGTASIGEDITERKRVERQLNIQYAISRILSESAALEQAAPKVLQAICETLNWDVGALWTMDHRAGVLRCNEIWSAPDIHVDDFKTPSRQMTFARGLGLPGRVWASGQSAWIRDVTQDKNFTRAAAAKQAGLHGAFAFPILVGNGVGGVIECFSREARESDGSLLRTDANLGGQLGLFFERRRVEEHLFQSQKMETVGRLAGGIAHEFNSILTAIIGHSELLLGDLPAGSPLAKNATEISKAAGRAATLTRQLLAYGRKQILRPEILNLNVVLTGMESMLLHLMGRSVDVRIASAVGLKNVKADAGQIEQVIMNIAMNAADAMPNGGKLTLETANVTLDQEYVGRFSELKAGEYVMLAITDTGAGMSEEVKARIFEPFFTTKGVGQGTGLGLSTCYGIIKQSGGHIAVYSEPARGATFKIYLPQVEQQTKIPIQHLDSPDLPRGTEIILLVEDDPALREMAATLLRRLGYTVLAAANGIEALSLKQQRDIGHIDLLFIDVVMPHMSGKELSERVRALYPHTRILFTSAYTENAIVHQGVLNKGVALLPKPFTPSALAHKVREILDSGKA